jgi:hypothetical protein
MTAHGLGSSAPHSPSLHFDSIADLDRAIEAREVGRDDVVYVSPVLYGRMSYPQQTALRNRLLELRIRLVSDLPMLHGVEVMRAGGTSAPDLPDDR